MRSTVLIGLRFDCRHTESRVIRKIGVSPDLKGVHMSVGLTNLGIMLPAKAPEGLLTQSVTPGSRAGFMLHGAGLDSLLRVPDSYFNVWLQHGIPPA